MRFLTCTSILFVPLLAVTAGALAAPLIERQFPAAGEQALYIDLPHAGRYAIEAAGGHGVQLQWISKADGPGARDGVPGTHDGRLDLLLGAGRTKLVARSPKGVTGAATLTVKAFSASGGPARKLAEFATVSSALTDYQRRDFVLEIAKPRWINLELAGRSLGAVELWRDGWRQTVKRWRERIEPAPGRPLTVIRLAAWVRPGSYRLATYGARPLVWANPTVAGSGERMPLYLRWGIPELTAAALAVAGASPFGVDRYRVPININYIRMDLPRRDPAALRIARFSAKNPFPGAEQEAAITRKSRRAEARLELPAANGPVRIARRTPGYRVLSVLRRPGAAYRLRLLDSRARYDLLGGGDYWVAVLGAGDRDDPPVSAMLGEFRRGGKSRLLRSGAVRVSPGSGYRQSFNVSGRTSVFVQLTEDGPYTFTAPGVAARIRPFTLRGNSRWVDLAAANGKVELNRGFFELELRGDAPRKIELAIQYDDSVAAPRVGAGAPGIRLGVFTLHADRLYRLQPGQSGNPVGLVVRRLPLDLAEAVSLPLAAHDVAQMPVRVTARGRVVAEDDRGNPLAVALAHTAFGDSLDLAAGVHDVRVRNSAASGRLVTLRFLPRDPPVFAAPEPVAPRMVMTGVELPVRLSGEQAVFGFAIRQPGFYRIESLGLLATSGQLDTRLQPALARAEGGGSGRNFLISRYLDAGEYRLRVATRGRSRGDARLSVSRVPAPAARPLSVGDVARGMAPGDAGLAYAVDISVRGRYATSVLTLGRGLPWRLLAPDGWPVRVARDGEAAELGLSAGRHSLIIAPPLETLRAVASVKRIPETKPRAGHGPHAIAIGSAVNHRWLEPAQPGAPRSPDVWTFELPARASVRINAGRAMTGQLWRADDPNTPLAEVTAADGYSGELAPGEYRLTLTALRRDNRRPYRLHVAADELLPGASRKLELPADIRVSLGDAPAVIESLGRWDVRARLLDDDGRLVTAADDREGDWNFILNPPAGAGRYRLIVTGTGPAQSTVTVRARALITREHTAIAPGDMRELSLPERSVLPIAAGAAVADSLVTLRARGNVGLSLQARTAGGSWRTVAQEYGSRSMLAVPGDGVARRLLLENAQGRRVAASVALARLDPRPGAAFSRLAPAAFPLSVAAARVERAGVFALTPGTLGVLSAHRGVAVNGRPVALPEGLVRFFIAGDLAANKAQLRRVLLGARPLSVVPVTPRVAIDIARAETPRLVMIRGGRAGAVCRQQRCERIVSGPSDSPGVLLNAGMDAARMRIDAHPGREPLVLEARNLSARAGTDAGSAWRDAPLADSVLTSNLGAGVKRLQLALPAQSGVRLAGASDGLQIYSGAKARRIDLHTTAGAAQFFGRRGSIAFRIGPDSPGAAHVSRDGVLWQSARAPGWYRPPTEFGTEIRVAGAAKVLAGEWIEHGAELWAAWADKDAPGANAKTIRFTADDRAPRRLAASAALLLRMPGARTRLLRAGDSVLHFPGAADAFISFWPLAGQADLSVEPLAAVRLRDGVGGQSGLAADSQRLFELVLSTSSRLGIGLRGAGGSVAARLYDARGALVGSGVTQIRDLPAGRYWLAVRNTGTEPRWITPVVAGLEPPGDGPPGPVIAQFLRSVQPETEP